MPYDHESDGLGATSVVDFDALVELGPSAWAKSIWDSRTRPDGTAMFYLSSEKVRGTWQHLVSINKIKIKNKPCSRKPVMKPSTLTDQELVMHDSDVEMDSPPTEPNAGQKRNRQNIVDEVDNNDTVKRPKLARVDHNTVLLVRNTELLVRNTEGEDGGVAVDCSGRAAPLPAATYGSIGTAPTGKENCSTTYDGMTLAGTGGLRELLVSRGLRKTGSKAEVVARLTMHDHQLQHQLKVTNYFSHV